MNENAQKLLSQRITKHLLRDVKRPLTKWLFGKRQRDLDPAEQSAYWNIRSKIWEHNNPGTRRYAKHRAKLYALGLTSRGTPRKYFMVGFPKTPQEIAWRRFRATLDIQNTAIS